MLIAITSDGPSLDAWLDQRFGRSPYFLIVNTNDMSFEAIENNNVSLGGGAGIKSAQLIVDKKVTHVLTGACGPNAYGVLCAAGIEVITGCSGLVKDVINYFKEGALVSSEGPNVADHFGISGGFSQNADPAMGTPNMPATGMGQGMG
ncbi:MAG TPA: NifB/NifX family molybdenum-iron cluster-binding protein, partial [Syntrophorhabdaceae bacterium]|nr:NifB/NifX family molybdenum-iron cluster-binding protein [Syntrophorhabdaceae bacterium]